ncbi:MAG: hypothetical protein KAI66_03760 [Lentisphaeria bacterium]|nr:hypothetical protein [Lentisphaeria bacterium]
MSDRRVFFFDDRALLDRSGLSLRPVPVEKHGVIMDREGPSDLGGVSVFAGSVIPLDDGRFRMFYYVSRRTPSVMRIAIAESEDGFQWTRPLLGQETWEGRDTNHIRIEGLSEGANITQPSVVRLPDGSWRMYCWLHGQDRGIIRYIVSDSDDGLRWRSVGLDQPAVFHPSDLEVGQAGWTAGLTQAHPNGRFEDRRVWDFMAAKRLRSNDATNVYYDAETGLFEMFSVWLLPNKEGSGRRTPHDNAPAVLRVIHRRVSEDGLNWGDAELVITPDASDPLSQQFYYLAQHREEDWRIGFLGNYPCWDQTMDLEMCFSRDGREWLRPLRGGFVPRGPVPEPDCMSVYATNALLSVADDRNLLLYRGGNNHHNHSLPEGVDEEWWGILGASWRRGRFAGMTTAPNSIGRLLFKPFVQNGGEISLDADIRGHVRAELRDPVSGKRMEGFELHDSHALSGDSSRIVLRWGEEGRSTACYQHDPLSLYLEIHDGTIYSVNL